MEENVVRFNQVEEKILTIRNQSVILDSRCGFFVWRRDNAHK